jgi:hypothetical protein
MDTGSILEGLSNLRIVFGDSPSIEELRHWMFAGANASITPSFYNNPSVSTASIFCPGQALKLAYQCYKDDFKRFKQKVVEEYEMHRDYFKDDNLL